MVPLQPRRKVLMMVSLVSLVRRSELQVLLLVLRLEV
jgi:hypothetical protein